MRDDDNSNNGGAIRESTGLRPSQKRLLRWAITAIFLIPVGWLSGAAVLNYSGYCFKQSRYLTDEEQIRPLLQNIFLSYPKITYAYNKLPKAGFEVIDDKSRCCDGGDRTKYDESQGGTALDTKELILYGDMDEFLAMNPDCCSFTRNGLYGEYVRTELWSKVTGYSAGFVNIKFRVRYRDVAGNEETKFSAHSGNKTNCGVAVSTIFD